MSGEIDEAKRELGKIMATALMRADGATVAEAIDRLIAAHMHQLLTEMREVARRG